MQKMKTCQGCKQCLPWSADDPIMLGNILRNKGRHGFADSRQVYCDNCKYPTCGKCCIKPRKPPSAAHMHEGIYVCLGCRFPPCASGCGTPRPRHQNEYRYSIFHMETWTCSACQWNANLQEAKEHLMRTGKQNMWLKDIRRGREFKQLSTAQQKLLRQLPRWKDPE